jgi:hypothetical protein
MELRGRGGIGGRRHWQAPDEVIDQDATSIETDAAARLLGREGQAPFSVMSS